MRRKKFIYDLILPSRDYNFKQSAYGDRKIIHNYLRLSTIWNRPWLYKGEWQHGWIPVERNIHPELVAGNDGKSFEKRRIETYFVARDDQVVYLKSQGYKNVYAIGLPIIYTNPIMHKRILNSILYMPSHSLPDGDPDLAKYLSDLKNYLKELKKKFSKVVVCLHINEINKKYFFKILNDLEITFIAGADPDDANSLDRMRAIFSQFEFVTTDMIGSHVVYASYCGCKVSVFGPRRVLTKKELNKIKYFKNCKECMHVFINWSESNFLLSKYPFFDCKPWLAKKKIKWATFQLGEQHKLSPEKMKNIMGLNLNSIIYCTFNKIVRRVFHQIKSY
jgi:hypothetical protein